MKQKIYITKYALTKGIIEEEAEIKDYPNNKKGVSAWVIRKYHSQHYYNEEFHFSIEEAVADANKRVAEKIKSLEDQIKKLQKKKFE